MASPTTGNGLPDVVVTGIAMTTSVATSAEGTWSALLEGKSGIRRLEDPFVEQFELPVKIGGHLLEDFDSDDMSYRFYGDPDPVLWRFLGAAATLKETFFRST